MAGLGPGDVMPHWMQVACINHFAPDAFTMYVSPDGLCELLNAEQWDNIIDNESGRFLMYYKNRHLMCCRIDYTNDGPNLRLMCTCASEMQESAAKMLMHISTCYFPTSDKMKHGRLFTQLISSCTIDHLCQQQPWGQGGCVVMSLCNLQMTGVKSASSSQGENFRSAFRRLLMYDVIPHKILPIATLGVWKQRLGHV